MLGIGIIGVAIIGLFVMGRGGQPAETPSDTESAVLSVTTDYHDNIYLTRTAARGAYMTDFAGMTLYTYDRDTNGVSACDATCATTWRPYTSGATAQGVMPHNITVITREDGSQQFAWMGKPLYYYTGDQHEGDTTGDNKDGAWHVVGM